MFQQPQVRPSLHVGIDSPLPTPKSTQPLIDTLLCQHCCLPSVDPCKTTNIALNIYSTFPVSHFHKLDLLQDLQLTLPNTSPNLPIVAPIRMSKATSTTDTSESAREISQANHAPQPQKLSFNRGGMTQQIYSRW